MLKRKVLYNVREKEVIDLLSDLVKIPSENYRPTQIRGGEGEICEFLRRTFSDIGFDDIEIQETRFQGIFNVIGRIRGLGGGPNLLFNGHMDTIPAYDMPDPFSPKIIDGRLFGRGACDMKGGLTSMIIACKRIIDADVDLKGDLYMSAVVDEEVTHEGIDVLVRSGIKADYAIVGEPTDMDIVYSSMGKAEFQIETYGRAAHCSKPEFGINAIVKMAKIISTLDSNLSRTLRAKSHPKFGTPVFTVVNINGGLPITLSTVPEKCKIEIDRRLIPGETYEEAIREIEEILNRLKVEDPELQVELRLTDEVLRYPRLPFATPIESKLISALSRSCAEVTGKVPDLKVGSFYGDAEALRNRLGIHSVYFGPGAISLAHSNHEYVPISQVINASKILALTAMEVCELA
jgi:acetylornithine deacetylase/succinyl-diaminopimelate desuccinylase family protein